MDKLTQVNAIPEDYLFRIGADGYSNESTGMEYVIHFVGDSFYLEAWHEDVGLVTWFYWPGTEDALIDLILEEES